MEATAIQRAVSFIFIVTPIDVLYDYDTFTATVTFKDRDGLEYSGTDAACADRIDGVGDLMIEVTDPATPWARTAHV